MTKSVLQYHLKPKNKNFVKSGCLFITSVSYCQPGIDFTQEKVKAGPTGFPKRPLMRATPLQKKLSREKRRPIWSTKKCRQRAVNHWGSKVSNRVLCTGFSYHLTAVATHVQVSDTAMKLAFTGAFLLSLAELSGCELIYAAYQHFPCKSYKAQENIIPDINNQFDQYVSCVTCDKLHAFQDSYKVNSRRKKMWQ